MADCISCGKKLGFFDGDLSNRCSTCVSNKVWPNGHEKQVAQQIMLAKISEIDAIMLTTEAYPEGLKISKRIEIVTAECAFGMNIFKDLFAGVRDIVGGRSEAVQKTMRDSRRTALYELKREAHAVGANAVVGVDLDYVELSGVGNMVLLVASGTAVRIEN